MKTKQLALVLFSFLLLFSIVAPVRSQVLPYENMVLYWSYAEGSGTSTYDASGNGHIGTILNGSWVVGSFGYGIEFNGTDSYVSTPNTATLNLSRWTLSTWVYHLDNSTDQEYITKDQNFYMGFISGEIITGFRDVEGPSYKTANSSFCPLENTWYHVAGVYDGIEVRVYVNGVELGSVSATTTPNMANSTVWVGTSNNVDRFMNGTLDESRIYSRALSLAEIQVLAGVDDSPETPTLVTLNMDMLWTYLFSGDFAGFFMGSLAVGFSSTALGVAFISLIGFSAIYLRTKSLLLMSIIWIILGPFLIIVMPEVSLFAIILVVLGVAGMLYKLFRPDRD